MNGRDLMESLGHVDEQYIAEAEEAPQRRSYLQALVISAACLALVLAGLYRYQFPKASEQTADAVPAVMSVGTSRSLKEAAEENSLSAPAPMMASAPVMMTVQVVEQDNDTLICVVTDPGTSDYQPEEQVKILLPEYSLPEAAALDAESEPPQYEVFFLPDQGSDTIIPTQWSLLTGSN